MGDISATVAALLDRVKPREERVFLDESLARKGKAMARLEKRATVGKGGAIHPQYLADLIAKHGADDGVLTADAGSPTVWLLRHVPATGRNRTLVSLTHGTMAGAMPQALGAAAAFPDRQVISLSGDGGLTMLLGDLLTAVQEKLPIKVAVVNNSSLAFVELEQKTEGLLGSYVDLHNPDFGRLAEVMGLWGRRVEQAEDLEGAVQAWLAEPGPALLDVVTDRFELVIPSHVAPAQVLGTALYSAKAILRGHAGEVASLVSNNLSS